MNIQMGYLKYGAVYLMTILLLSACLSACGGSSNNNNTTTPPVVIVEPDPVSTLNIRISSPEGTVIEDINIEATSDTSMITSTSDMDGTATLEVDPDSKFTLLFTADGYANQVINVRSPSENGVISLDVTMLERGFVQTFDAAVGGSFSDTDGATVMLPANAFVDASGNLVTGNVDLTITPVNVSNKSILEAFPGEFTGIQTDGTETPIISFGTVEYHFTQNGEQVQLADNATAPIELPIYIDTYEDGSAIKNSDLIPLWSLNENTGIWEQEGEGQVVINKDSPTGYALQTNVTHFSWWNIDIPFSDNSGQVEITVLGSKTGIAVINFFTEVELGWIAPTRRVPVQINEATNLISLPSTDQMCFYADVFLTDNTYGVSNTVCITPTSGTITAFDLLAPNDSPLDIVANTEAGQITVNENTGFPMNRIKLQPFTSETSVSYRISNGALPPGLSIKNSSNTKAEIVGVPTQEGTYTVEIEGNNGTETDIVFITFNVTITDSINLTDPILIQDFVTEFQTFSIDLNAVNLGPTSIIHWELLDGSGTIPSWLDLDETSGNLTIFAGSITDARNWNGFVRAKTNNNSVGVANITIDISVLDLCAFMPDDPLCQGG